MENGNIIFGTYSFSPDGSTLSFNAPAFLPKNMLDKVYAGELFEKEESQDTNLKDFDTSLKAVVVTVPNSELVQAD